MNAKDTTVRDACLALLAPCQTASLERYGKGDLVLKFGAMYDAPEVPSLDRLLELRTLFGAKNISVDHYSNGGCETCDWGSDYGHELYIIGPTRNADGLFEWKKEKP